MAKFQIGDVAILNSGSEAVTVRRIQQSPDGTEEIWYSREHEGHIEHGVLPAACFTNCTKQLE